MENQEETHRNRRKTKSFLDPRCDYINKNTH